VRVNQHDQRPLLKLTLELLFCNIYIRISVNIPEKLSKEAKKLIEELKKEGL